MIRSSLLLFASLIVTSVISLPSSPLGLDIDSNSLEFADSSNLQSDSEASGGVGCTPDASTTDLSDGTIEGDQDLNIVRRQLRTCPVDVNQLFGGKKPLTIPSQNPSPQSTKIGDSEKPCTDPSKQEYLVCGGAEVWDNNELFSVLDCVLGKFPKLISSVHR